MAAREEDRKLGPTHHEHVQALEKVIAAEHEAQKKQAENTAALQESTSTLYGKSPGFIPGLQDAIASLAKFETSVTQAGMSATTASMSLGAGGAPGAAGAGGGFGLSSGQMGVGGDFGGVKFTHYGYAKDSTPDSYSKAGIGDRSNKLVDRYSAALTVAQRFALFGTKGHSTGREFNFAGRRLRDDDTAPESDRRVDLYDPTSTASSAFGGLFTRPDITRIAERVPEMVVPLENTMRSRSLLGAAASMAGFNRGAAGGGSGHTHLNFNAPINVHGVQTGNETAVASEVQRALRDPIRKLLEELKKAKLHEQRLSYA
jgi:hypothetical protein